MHLLTFIHASVPYRIADNRFVVVEAPTRPGLVVPEQESSQRPCVFFTLASVR